MRTRLFNSFVAILIFSVIGSGCSKNDPEACYTVSSYTDTINQVISFNASCTKNCKYYYWDFGDGTVIKTQNATHSYAAEGVYTVIFWASNSSGSTQGPQSTITV